MKRLLLLIFIVLIGFEAYSQSVNDYKYVLLPTKFDFLSKDDQYRLNTQARFLLKKHGFDVYYASESLPKDLNNNNCLALTANIKKVKAFLATKLVVELSNCYNQVIFTSKEGYSKEKTYKEAYREALIDAFESFNDINYKYNGLIKQTVVEVKEEPKEEIKIIETPKVEEKVDTKKGLEEIKKAKENKPSWFGSYPTFSFNDEVYALVPKFDGVHLTNSEKVTRFILKQSIKPGVFIAINK